MGIAKIKDLPNFHFGKLRATQLYIFNYKYTTYTDILAEMFNFFYTLTPAVKKLALHSRAVFQTATQSVLFLKNRTK